MPCCDLKFCPTINNEISNYIQQITGVVEETTKGTQETAAAAAQLARQAQELQELIGRFQVA